MSEPLVTPVAMYTLGGTVAAGHFLGMPIDAVVLGAMASAAVTMWRNKKRHWRMSPLRSWSVCAGSWF